MTFEDFKCARVLEREICKQVKKYEGAYLPMHVESTKGFLRILSDSLTKYVELKHENKG